MEEVEKPLHINTRKTKDIVVESGNVDVAEFNSDIKMLVKL